MNPLGTLIRVSSSQVSRRRRTNSLSLAKIETESVSLEMTRLPVRLNTQDSL